MSSNDMRKPVAWIAPVVLIWIAGCAPATGTVREPDTLYGELRGCAKEELPAELPAVDMLVDTGYLAPALRDVREALSVDTGSVTLTMWYDPDGSNARRSVVLSTVGPAVADSVQELVFAALRPMEEADDPWGVRLQLGMGQEIDYSVDRREYCPPRPRDLAMEEAINRMTYGGAGRRRHTVVMEVLVHPLGYVVDAEVVRGATGGGTLERRLADYMRSFSFEPARLDGIPVAGRITVPVRVRS